MKFIEKYKSMTNVAKASIWFVVCNFLLQGISFISAPIFTRLLPDNEYGKLTIYLSFEKLFLIFATWEIQIGAYQKGIYKFKDNINTFTCSIQLLINILTLACFFIITIFYPLIRKVTGFSPLLMSLLFLYLLVYPAYYCWMVRKRSIYEYKSVVCVTLLYSVATTVVSLLAVIFLRPTADIKLGSTLIISIVICIFAYIPNANYCKLRKKKNEVKRMWSYAIKFEGPLVMHSLSYLLLAQADRVMIGHMVGESQAGYYSVAYSLATAIIVIQNALEQSLLPWRYQKLEEQKYDDIRKMTNILLTIVGGIILLFILIAPDAMRLLFTQNYQEAIWCIPPISIGVYFMLLYSIFVSVETFFEKTHYVMYVSVACGILNVFMNYFGIKTIGYIACAYTTLICYILFAIGHFGFARKASKTKIPVTKIFNGKFIFLISFLVLCASILITAIYSYTYIRYGITSIILLLILLLRRKVVTCFKIITSR